MEIKQTESVESENVQNQCQEEPQYFNPHYFHQHHPPSPPPSPLYETQEHSNNPTHYEPLHTDTRDYTSVYSTTTAAGRRGAPSVEVEGKLYSIVNPTRRDEHVYSAPQQ